MNMRYVEKVTELNFSRGNKIKASEVSSSTDVYGTFMHINAYFFMPTEVSCWQSASERVCVVNAHMILNCRKTIGKNQQIFTSLVESV